MNPRFSPGTMQITLAPGLQQILEGQWAWVLSDPQFNRSGVATGIDRGQRQMIVTLGLDRPIACIANLNLTATLAIVSLVDGRMLGTVLQGPGCEQWSFDLVRD